MSHYFDIIGQFFGSIGHLLFDFLAHLPPHYAYVALGVLITLESMGIPLPAESVLIFLSIYAARTHHLSLQGVMSASIIGAIIGDNIGYFIGHHFGYRLLEKHGSKIGINADRLTLGRYLFRRFGGMGVLLGRFLAILRILIALLAGAIRMPWKQFMLFNALGGILWAGGYTYIAYTIGDQIERFSGPVGLSIGAVIIIGLGIGFFTLKRHEQTLLEKARHDEERHNASSKSVKRSSHS